MLTLCCFKRNGELAEREAVSEQARAGTWLTMGEVVWRENSACGGWESTEACSAHRPSILPPAGHGLMAGRSIRALCPGSPWAWMGGGGNKWIVTPTSWSLERCRDLFFLFLHRNRFLCCFSQFFFWEGANTFVASWHDRWGCQGLEGCLWCLAEKVPAHVVVCFSNVLTCCQLPSVLVWIRFAS